MRNNPFSGTVIVTWLKRTLAETARSAAPGQKRSRALNQKKKMGVNIAPLQKLAIPVLAGEKDPSKSGDLWGPRGEI